MKQLIQSIQVYFCFAALFLITSPLYAQDGTPDFTFDSDGIVTTDFSGDNDEANSMAIQTDGKIVVAGYAENISGYYNFALARYNTDGSLDNTFDSDGRVITAIGTMHSSVRCISLQPDGKIVVAGSSFNTSYQGQISLARYNSNGSLDTTFDGDGIVTTINGSNSEWGEGIKIQTDGKILVAGTSHDPIPEEDDFFLFRYNANGSLDNTFDSDGMVYTDLGSGSESGEDLILQSDGKILVTGQSGIPGNANFALVRYNTDGTLDATFDSDGIVTTDFGGTEDWSNGVVVQSDGKILLCGAVNQLAGTFRDIGLVRYNTNGSLDITFDGDGMLTTDITNSRDDAYEITLQSDGKILIAGASEDSAFINRDILLLRYNPNGSLDASFDTDGIVTVDIGGYDEANDITLQADGKILVAGFGHDFDEDFVLCRFNGALVGNPEEIEPEFPGLTAQPNPFNASTQIEFNTQIMNGEITLFNIQGQKVKTISGVSGQSIIIHRENLASGLYFINFMQEDKLIASAKLMIMD